VCTSPPSNAAACLAPPVHLGFLATARACSIQCSAQWERPRLAPVQAALLGPRPRANGAAARGVLCAGLEPTDDAGSLFVAKLQLLMADLAPEERVQLRTLSSQQSAGSAPGPSAAMASSSSIEPGPSSRGMPELLDKCSAACRGGVANCSRREPCTCIIKLLAGHLAARHLVQDARASVSTMKPGDRLAGRAASSLLVVSR